MAKYYLYLQLNKKLKVMKHKLEDISYFLTVGFCVTVIVLYFIGLIIKALV